MKVCLCCIAKMENKYIREYLEHYLGLGFDKIFIYDNNDVDGERFEDVIADLIGDKVEVVDCRGKKVYQLTAYQDCYDKNKNDYDWMAFFDCDEFLTLTTHKTIQDYLSDEMINGFDMVHLNWLTYDDNNKVYYENKKMCERFPNYKKPINFKKVNDIPENFHIKSIIKCDGEIKWMVNPHSPISNKSCCNEMGIICDGNSPFSPYSYTFAYLKHYTTKTIEEYATNKMVKGIPDRSYEESKKSVTLKNFFLVNELTDEKIEYIRKEIDENFGKEEKKELNCDVDIFINAIEGSQIPLKNSVYKVLELGGCDLSKNTNLERFKDNTRFNISNLNKSICEFTGMYWVHMNYPIKKYVGFCQYRKYFSFFDNIPNIDEIFKTSDVILCKPFFPHASVKQHYEICHNIEDYNKIKSIVDEIFPEYSASFEELSNANAFFPCNLFIMKKDDFHRYCEFICQVLGKFLQDEKIYIYEDCTKRVNENKEKYLKSFYPNDKVDYQSRFLAYLIERLTNVFIHKNFNKACLFDIKEIIGKYGTSIFK